MASKIRIGSAAYEKLPMARKIKLLVERGYKQVAFRSKSNAEMFGAAWKRKGYTPRGTRSSGPVIEGGYQRNAYYVMAGNKR